MFITIYEEGEALKQPQANKCMFEITSSTLKKIPEWNIRRLYFNRFILDMQNVLKKSKELMIYLEYNTYF